MFIPQTKHYHQTLVETKYNFSCLGSQSSRDSISRQLGRDIELDGYLGSQLKNQELSSLITKRPACFTVQRLFFTLIYMYH